MSSPSLAHALDDEIDLDILRALKGQELDMTGLVKHLGVHRGLVRIARCCDRLQSTGLIFLDTARAMVGPYSPVYKLTATGRLELKKHEGGAKP